MARCRAISEKTIPSLDSPVQVSVSKPKKRYTTKKRSSNGRRRNPTSEVRRDFGLIEEHDDNRFYVIEELLDKRYTSDGQEEYLVRWKNYSPEWDSWEPRIEIERNARDMILDFNRGLKPDSETLHCTCRRPYRFEHGGMIQCFNCHEWFHFTCLNIDMEQANLYAKFYCGSCRSFNPGYRNMIKPEKVVAPWFSSSQESDDL